MGDGVNIAARLESICQPGAICLSEDAYRQVTGRLDLAVTDLGPTELKNIAEPIRMRGSRAARQPRPALGAPQRRSFAPPGSSVGCWRRKCALPDRDEGRKKRCQAP
jgi:adenylate cyclase